jgi:hypothetical protein
LASSASTILANCDDRRAGPRSNTYPNDNDNDNRDDDDRASHDHDNRRGDSRLVDSRLVWWPHCRWSIAE